MAIPEGNHEAPRILLTRVRGALRAVPAEAEGDHREDLSAVETVRRSFGLPSRGKELFVMSGGQGYIYRSEDIACSVEEFSERCRPHLEAAQRQLAEAIDRG